MQPAERTAEEAMGVILHEGDHLQRMPGHSRRTALSRRDYIRGRLLLMIAKETIDRVEYEALAEE